MDKNKNKNIKGTVIFGEVREAQFRGFGHAKRIYWARDAEYGAV